MKNLRVHDIKKAQKERFLFRELSQLYSQLSLDNPQLREMSLTRVSLSRDKSTCVIYFYTPQGREQFDIILEILKLYKSSIRKILAQKIAGKYTPEIVFKFDDTYEKQQHIEELFDKIKSSEE